MNQPVIHPTSEHHLSHLLRDMPQSLLLTGVVGVGLGTVAHSIAHHISNEIITVLPEKDEKIDIDKGSISVDSIRRLYTQTRTKQVDKRVVVIDYAERMAQTAQNAFLKLLEEPGEGTYFILATHLPSKLLPTITSRTQALELLPITRDQTQQFITDLGVTDETKRTQLSFMADGRPAELTRLMADDDYFARRSTIVRDARDLLQGSMYKKLAVAHTYKDDRSGALTLITDAAMIIRKSISAKPQEDLIKQIDSLLYAHKQIQANGNIRLCLARLVV